MTDLLPSSELDTVRDQLHSSLIDCVSTSDIVVVALAETDCDRSSVIESDGTEVSDVESLTEALEVIVCETELLVDSDGEADTETDEDNERVKESETEFVMLKSTDPEAETSSDNEREKVQLGDSDDDVVNDSVADMLTELDKLFDKESDTLKETETLSKGEIVTFDE